MMLLTTSVQVPHLSKHLDETQLEAQQVRALRQNTRAQEGTVRSTLHHHGIYSKGASLISQRSLKKKQLHSSVLKGLATIHPSEDAPLALKLGEEDNPNRKIIPEEKSFQDLLSLCLHCRLSVDGQTRSSIGCASVEKVLTQVDSRPEDNE